MRISVALASYNGERFIEEQLASFAAQERLPDELVVSDDASTDRTVPIVRSFASRAPFPVTCLEHPVNVGYAQNFGRAIAACSGDLILLSDQDDVWFPHKVKRIESAFEGGPEVVVSVNDIVVTDEDLNPTGPTYLDGLRRLKRPAEDMVTGCATAFRALNKDLILPIPNGATHDGWIHAVLPVVGVKRVIDEPLQLFRRHGANSSVHVRRFGMSRWSIRRPSSALPRLRRRAAIVEALIERLGGGPSGTVAWHSELHRLRIRIDILESPLMTRIVKVLGAYTAGEYRDQGGWKAVIRDLVASS